MAFGDALAQHPLAAHIGIVGIAAAQAFHGGIDDRHRRVEIRVAHREQQNVLALCLQGQGAVVNIPRGGAVTGDALSQCGKTHGALLIV
ncbi:hypothetical protein D3C75_1186270 [compost metagenome]